MQQATADKQRWARERRRLNEDRDAAEKMVTVEGEVQGSTCWPALMLAYTHSTAGSHWLYATYLHSYLR